VDGAIWLVAVGFVAFALGWWVAARRLRTRIQAAARAEARRDEELVDQVRAGTEERRRMDLVLSSMLEGVVLFGPDGQTVFANPAAETHLGVTPRSVSNLLPLPIQEAARRASGPRQGRADAVGSRSLAAGPPCRRRGDGAPVVRDVT
jgi:PAS domain-containing protein